MAMLVYNVKFQMRLFDRDASEGLHTYQIPHEYVMTKHIMFPFLFIDEIEI